MKLRIFICLILLTLFSSAQNNFFKPDTITNQLIINSIGGIASTSIPQNFMNKFILPGFINKELKDEVSSNMSPQNLFGGEFISDLHLYLEPGSLSKNGFWGIGFGYNVEGNLNFTKDLFNLTFYGNQAYPKEKLNFNKTSFNLLSYSYLDFTLGKTYKKHNTAISYWIDFGVVLGHNYMKIDLSNAELFTANNGSYIDFAISNGKFSIIDELNDSFIKGIGGKINLNFSYTSEKTTLIIQAKNLGAIHWNSLISSNLDTTFRFEGIEIKNIFELSDSVMEEVNILDTLIDSKKKNSVALLPIDLNVYHKRRLGKSSIDIFLRHRLFTNYNPYVRIGFYYQLPILTPGLTLGYGGYSTTQIGLNTELNFRKKVKIVLGTNNIIGAFSTQKSKTLDVYLGLKLNL